jgi:hypothetical protein
VHAARNPLLTDESADKTAGTNNEESFSGKRDMILFAHFFVEFRF